MADEIPDVLHLNLRCRCGRKVPNRVFTEAAAFFRQLSEQANVPIPPTLAISTTKCDWCKEIVVITARAMHFTPPHP